MFCSIFPIAPLAIAQDRGEDEPVTFPEYYEPYYDDYQAAFKGYYTYEDDEELD